MKKESNPDRLPPAVIGLLIFAGCVVIALIIYWVIVVQNIMEQRRINEGSSAATSQIYQIPKYHLT